MTQSNSPCALLDSWCCEYCRAHLMHNAVCPQGKNKVFILFVAQIMLQTITTNQFVA